MLLDSSSSTQVPIKASREGVSVRPACCTAAPVDPIATTTTKDASDESLMKWTLPAIFDDYPPAAAWTPSRRPCSRPVVASECAWAAHGFRASTSEFRVRAS